ncbi:MAG: gfo/Idh/MocA family oxidoreductase, partial [Verrucomicrobiales bacterium]|nr:gfo/Idh/MocA family oxidoreductase [Verrucomicrobiales bacterium]
DYPERVTCNGGRYMFDDDQETPDTSVAFYDYGREKGALSWENSSSHRRKPRSAPFVSVVGDGGKMDFSSSNYTVYDRDGKEIAKNTEKASDIPHFTNFANSIRVGEPLNQPIDDAQIGAMLCHYANMAYRTSGTLQIDPKTGQLVKGQPEAEKLWARPAYREGFEIG